ncbi:hypothetical protein [Flavobacterium sp.]|uniref:hypothetical protein n=1 Tax=Flavobacterium sp. TaxID=239 RepID=UPI002FD984CF
MDRDNIFNNIDDLPAEQLFEYIIQGIVTLPELRQTGQLDASKRRVIEKLLKDREKEEEEFWEQCIENNTISAFSDYIEKYPNGIFKLEAKNKISHLEDDNAWNNAQDQNTILSFTQYLGMYPNGKFTLEAKNKIKELEENGFEIGEIKKNPKEFPADKIRYYLSNGQLSKEDLLQKNIPEEVIHKLLKNESTPDFVLGSTPASIPDGFTEVYFWGIRGSGKTTALSAVLSTANKNGLLEIAQGPGYNYMLQLQNLFYDKISTLPAGTPSDKTQYLPFILKKSNERNARSVSLIELSGEIFQCFLYKNASKPLPTKQHEETFNTLIKYLNGPNRKMHFFFVDYDRGNDADQDSYRQSHYLNAAATFFNDSQYNIFGKSTDAIYIVLTKSDLMPQSEFTKREQVKEYLNSSNYLGFVNSLRDKCKKHSINGGRILGLPFSLGTVYFEEICDFNSETAENIIDILMRRIDPKGNSILDVFNK